MQPDLMITFYFFYLNHRTTSLGLNGALFVEQSGTKKREWKTEMLPKIDCFVPRNDRLLHFVRNDKLFFPRIDSFII